MNDKKQTALEWYIQEIDKYNKEPWKYVTIGNKQAIIDKAKAMEKEKVYSEEDVVSILEYARKNFYDTGTKWHEEPYMDLTSQELIKKYHEQ
jgi:hypothetical protein